MVREPSSLFCQRAFFAQLVQRHGLSPPQLLSAHMSASSSPKASRGQRLLHDHGPQEGEGTSARLLGHDQRLRARLQWLGHLALHPNGHGCRKLFARVKNKEVSSFIQAEAVRRCLNHKENKKQRTAREFWDVDGSSHGRQPLDKILMKLVAKLLRRVKPLCSPSMVRARPSSSQFNRRGPQRAVAQESLRLWTSGVRELREALQGARKVLGDPCFWVWTEPVENPLNDGDRREVIGYILHLWPWQVTLPTPPGTPSGARLTKPI